MFYCYQSFEIESIVLICFECFDKFLHVLVCNCSDSWFVSGMLAWTMHMLASDGLSYVITRLLQGLVRFKFKDVHLALQLSSFMVMV